MRQRRLGSEPCIRQPRMPGAAGDGRKLGEAGKGSPQGPGGVRPGQHLGSDLSLRSSRARKPCFSPPARASWPRQLQETDAVAWCGFLFQEKRDPDVGLVSASHR